MAVLMGKKRKTKRKPPTIDQTIRAAIAAKLDDGESLNRLARAAGYCDHSQLARYMRGERGLATGPKFDGLLRVLNLEVARVR
jgi:hypothetical protein